MTYKTDQAAHIQVKDSNYRKNRMRVQKKSDGTMIIRIPNSAHTSPMCGTGNQHIQASGTNVIKGQVPSRVSLNAADDRYFTFVDPLGRITRLGLKDISPKGGIVRVVANTIRRVIGVAPLDVLPLMSDRIRLSPASSHDVNSTLTEALEKASNFAASDSKPSDGKSDSRVDEGV